MAECFVMSGAPKAQLVLELSGSALQMCRATWCEIFVSCVGGSKTPGLDLNVFSQRFCPARSVEILSNRCKSTVDAFVMRAVLRAFVRLGATI